MTTREACIGPPGVAMVCKPARGAVAILNDTEDEDPDEDVTKGATAV